MPTLKKNEKSKENFLLKTKRKKIHAKEYRLGEQREDKDNNAEKKQRERLSKDKKEENEVISIRETQQQLTGGTWVTQLKEDLKQSTLT